MKQHRLLPAILLVAAALMFTVAGHSATPRSTKGPLIHLQADGTISEATGCLDDFVGKGQYVLVDFWASWCGPCREETPNVIRLARKYGDKGLKVVGVTMQDKPEKSLEAIQQLGICYDQIFDLECIICNRFSIQGIPHFFLLDPEGNTVLQGHHNLDQFDAYLQQHL